jgi:hypothetical protein
MSDNPTSPPTQVQFGGFSRQADFRFQFANQARIRVSPGEITLVFSYLDEAPIGLINTEISAITMTPTHARRVMITLSEMLKEYVEKFGPIPPEPTATSRIDAAEIGKRIEERVKSRLAE